MRILGIDYGRKKIGLAISDGKLAEPLRVIRCKSGEEGIEKLKKVVEEEDVGKFVLGVSEGKMGEESKAFGKRLQDGIKLPVVFQDETLSTHQAQELSIEAGIGRMKRKKLEDAYSASLILQSYLDR